jgi:lipid II:glycine glycyltransferase (peptidoglycan interpeptide bridge formation enzyme)
VNFHHAFTDWLPFYWKGYRQTTRYNYILPDISHPEALWQDLSDNIKRNIQKAGNKYRLEVRRNVAVDLFLQVNDQTYERQGKKTYWRDTLKKLVETARARNQGDIWGAFDKDNRLHAAVFIVWQENCAYYVAGGGDSALRQSGAHALAMWEAIREISPFSASFSFSGSMLKGVERFFRGFGALQVPYYTISKGRIYLIEKIIGKIGGSILSFKKASRMKQ